MTIVMQCSAERSLVGKCFVNASSPEITARVQYLHTPFYAEKVRYQAADLTKNQIVMRDRYVEEDYSDSFNFVYREQIDCGRFEADRAQILNNQLEQFSLGD